MFPASRIADALGKCNFALAEIGPHRYTVLAMKPPEGDPDQYHTSIAPCAVRRWHKSFRTNLTISRANMPVRTVTNKLEERKCITSIQPNTKEASGCHEA